MKKKYSVLRGERSMNEKKSITTQSFSITKEQTTALKAIAILTVLIAHGNILAKAFETLPVLKDEMIISIFCQGGMCLFLILSGYGLFLSFCKNGMRNFWDNKFLKIFFPVIVAQLGWFLIYNVIKSIFEKGVEIRWSTVFADIVCVSPLNGIDGSIWYMSFLLFCYICFYCIFGFIKNTKVAMVVFSVLWIVLMPILIIVWMYGFYCVSAFAVGVWMAFFSNKKSFNVNIYVRIIASILFIAIGVGYYFVFRQSRIVDNIASDIIALAYIALIGFVNIEKSKVLNFIGKHSFSIYIFQGKIMFGWFPYENYSDSIKLLAYIVLFIVNILVAVAFDWVIKRITDRIN